MAVKKFNISLLNTTIIGTTLVTSLVCYNTYRPNAYEIFINGKTVAYVSDKNKAEFINNQIVDDISKRFKDVKVQSNLTYEKITALDEAITDDELSIKKNILSVLNIKLDALEMKIDNKSVGIVRNESDGAKIIELIGQYYLSKNDLDNKKFIGIKNKITYDKKQVAMTSIEYPEKLAQHLIESNKLDELGIKVQITGTVSEKVPINYSTVVVWDSSMLKGESKVKTKGLEGSKVIEKEITMINGVKSSEKKLKETILENPKSEIVVKGTKEKITQALSTSSMVVPSRGKITSAFGERWGKEHKGIDIAGNTGDPIYSALEGKVIYAGWESGYGNVIKLSHSGNLKTIYGHCSSIDVKVGQYVKKGVVIGKIGSTGNSTGPHLHFEVRLNDVPQNPSKYIYNKTEV